MEGSIKELSKYRMERAREMLAASDEQLENAKMFVSAVEEYLSRVL